MFFRTPIPPSLEPLVQSQAGVVTTAQLGMAGLSEAVQRRIAKDWLRLRDGLYLTGPMSWEAAAWAGTLAGGERAVLGGAAAAHLHGVFDAPSLLTVWLPGIAKQGFQVGPYGIQFRRGQRSQRGVLPRTSPEETLLDLAAETDEDSVVMAVTLAFSRRVSHPRRLQAALEARQRQRHRNVLQQLSGHAATGIESVLEWRFHTVVEKPHGLPPMTRQVRTAFGRVDGLHEDFGIIVELDGRSFHDVRRDMARDNSHALSGLLTLRYGWHDVIERPCSVANQLSSALASRGWGGVSRACARCRRVSF